MLRYAGQPTSDRQERSCCRRSPAFPHLLKSSSANSAQYFAPDQRPLCRFAESRFSADLFARTMTRESRSASGTNSSAETSLGVGRRNRKATPLLAQTAMLSGRHQVVHEAHARFLSQAVFNGRHIQVARDVDSMSTYSDNPKSVGPVGRVAAAIRIPCPSAKARFDGGRGGFSRLSASDPTRRFARLDVRTYEVASPRVRSIGRTSS